MITVIVPVYKVEDYLPRCVESILNQTYTDFRIILVDDGSPDNCGKMCDEYAKNDSRIVVLHRENGGLSAARNTGLDWFYENDNSEYIFFLDSDDWVHPQLFEQLMYPINEYGVKISLCGFQRAYTREEIDYPKYEDFNCKVLSPEDLLIEHTWDFNYACGKIFHRSLLENIRFPAGKVFEDTCTTYKALFLCEKVSITPIPLYYYYQNEAGISHAPWATHELVIFDAMREQLDFYKKNGYTRAYEKEHQLYVHHHAYQIVRIKENKEHLKKNKKILSKIRKDLKLLLKENKDKYTIHTMTYSYEAAYPVFMKFYGFVLKFKNRIKNLLRK